MPAVLQFLAVGNYARAHPLRDGRFFASRPTLSDDGVREDKLRSRPTTQLHRCRQESEITISSARCLRIAKRREACRRLLDYDFRANSQALAYFHDTYTE